MSSIIHKTSQTNLRHRLYWLRIHLRWRILILLILIVFSVVLVAPAILNTLGRYLIVEATPAPADAIVVLSGSIPDRALAAADLYRQGLAPRVFLTQGHLSPAFHYVESELGLDLPDDDEVNRQILRRLGVPDEAIFVPAAEAFNTEAEARTLRPLLQAHKVHRILLVTSKSHTRRAKQIFQWVLGKEVQVILVASPYDDFEPTGWWHRRRDAIQVAFEYQKMLAFYLGRWRIKRE